MRLLPYIISIGLLAVFSACNNPKPTTETTENDSRIFVSNAQFEQRKMKLITPEKVEFPELITVNGIIDVPPQNKAVITAIMGGYVKRIPFLIGDAVSKGQILLTVENQEFVTLQQEFLEVKQQLDYLKSEYLRQKQLYEENISSQKLYLKAQSDYQSALARYNGLKKQLQLININPNTLTADKISAVVPIYSPISGNVSELLVEQGSYVTPTSPLMKITNNDHLHLELTVFEKNVLKLKKEQPILFTISNTSDKEFSAKIHLIGTHIDSNRSIKVHAHIDDEKAFRFLSGMYVTANIITENRQGYGLPETAVTESDDAYFALKLNEKTDKGYYFDKVKINETDTHQNYIEIKKDSTQQFLGNGVYELIY